MRARIQLLGPVRLTIDGEPVDLRGARQQRLLAILALNEGNVVSTERLIDAVWPDQDLPPDPRATLRTYISRLRGSFGRPDSISSSGGGYALSRLDVSVDAREFEASMARAEATRPPQQRAELLGEALRLWRGPALESFVGEEWARGPAARLDGLRSVAVDTRAEALLQAGEIQLAIVDLEGAVRDHPLREAPLALLMTAFERAGRRPDALRAYQEYRRRLATDLGLEPGRELSQLERRILAGDATVGAPLPLRGYELGERIGDGAFAIVYRATQPAVGRTVAIKQIRAELANRPEFIRRFEAEAHLVARLEHPRIVPLYDFWREPDSAFLVMRWLPGGSLSQSLLDGPWSLERATQMASEVGEAIQAAHRAGVVHRDLKPENVLLDLEGHAYLTDFGIALDDHEGADPDAALSIGSPAYASPEQLRHERVGPASDIWGLGITLFETLTGRLPFAEAATQAELLNAQLNRELPSVRSLRPELPRQVDDVIARATAKEPAHRFRTADEFVLALAGASGTPALSSSAARGSRTVVPLSANPYKGLRAFDEADARDFHGRARLVDEIAARLRLDGPAGRFVLLVGPSGSGKSSVVRAGLVPALRRGLVERSDEWFHTTMTPGTHPFEELEAGLLRVAVNPPSSLLDQLRSDERGLLRASMRIVPDTTSEVMIVIDQFEELYTLCEDDGLRGRFLDALAAAATEPTSRVRIVATLRADFYDRPLERAGFAGLVRDHTIAVAPLAPDELEHAIVDPAASVGCHFEPGLVAAMVAEVGDQPGALPLLQFALTSLHDQQVSGLLTLDAYRRMGGLTGAIAERAEQLFTNGDEAHQRTCQQLFTRLVTLGQGVPDTRRRVPRSELGVDASMEHAVSIFGGARLLSFDRDGATREPTVELAHEALIRDWPRLRRWLDSDREGLRLHRHLTAASVAWAERGRDPGDLYRGGRLESATAWADGDRRRLNPVESEFLGASVAAHESEVRRERHRLVRLHRLLVAVGVVAAFAIIAGVVAAVQRGVAADQRDLAELATAEAESQQVAAEVAAAEAESQRVAAEAAAEESEIRRMVAQAVDQLDSDVGLALLIALEAYRWAPSNETLGGLQRVLVGLPRGWLGSLQGRMSYVDVARSEEGSVVAAAGELGIDVFDLDSRELVAGFEAENVTVVEVSADGSLVAAASETGEWWLLALPDLNVVDQGSGPTVATMRFAPFGDAVAFGDSGGGVSVVEDGDRRVLGGLDGSVEDLAWRFDGAQVIAGGSITRPARVFDALRGGQVGFDMIATGGATDGSSAVEFLGADALVANGPAVRFDVATGAEIGRFTEVDVRVNGRVRSLSSDSFIAVESNGNAWSADFASGSATPLAPVVAGGLSAIGTDSIVIASIGGSLMINDLSGERVLGTRVPLEPGRAKASVSDDGRIVVSGYRGPIGWWRPGPPPVELGRLEASQSYIRGNDLWVGTLAADGSGEFVMWTDEGEFESPHPYPEIAATIGMSPDGEILVIPTGNRETTLHVVDRRTGETLMVLADLDQAIPESEEFVRRLVSDIEFSPDGSQMVATTFGGYWGVWDTRTWSPLRPIESDDEFMDIAFSSDGRLAATLTLGGELSLRNAADLSLIAEPIAAHGVGQIGGRAVAFTSDGRFLVSDGDNGARLWDVQALQAIGGVFPHEGDQSSAQLAVEANQLMTVVGDDVVLWNLDVDAWFDIGCRAVGRSMTEAEWVQFGPRGQPYAATCDRSG